MNQVKKARLSLVDIATRGLLTFQSLRLSVSGPELDFNESCATIPPVGAVALPEYHSSGSQSHLPFLQMAEQIMCLALCFKPLDSDPR